MSTKSTSQKAANTSVGAQGARRSDLLANSAPVNYTDPRYTQMFRNLQGNILKGHGRDFSANIFLQFRVKGDELRRAIAAISSSYVTSAYKQLEEARQFQRFGIPGSMFGNLLLTASTYRKLGYENRLREWFEIGPENSNPAFPQSADFVHGMLAAAQDLGDHPEIMRKQERREPLEEAYLSQTIDALLILADDGEQYLHRATRDFVTQIERDGIANVVAVELGRALRNDDEEGIEHFGYVDGRSQPLFLTGDFKHLNEDGSIDVQKTTEKVNEKARRRESGAIEFWNPFASLDLALVRDEAVENEEAFGSYFVFRKLEQDVLRFSIAEQRLADTLHLEGSDRERAGAMIVGRFRDGTPLVLSETDGMIPSKSNDFRYDGLASTLQPDPSAPHDRLGARCPFQAHIRKTNPRQSVNAIAATQEQIRDAEAADRGRRIVRRGITFGERSRHPKNPFQTLDELPTGGVGLLFACFQSSIVRQFAFMQKTWANNVQFKLPLGTNPRLAPTGLDPLIGQPLDEDAASNPHQNWRKEYGGTGLPNPAVLTDADLRVSHDTSFNVSEFIRFRGGEFFFAPSLPFLLAGADGSRS